MSIHLPMISSVLLASQGDKGNVGPPGQKRLNGAEGDKGNHGPVGVKGPPGKQVDRSCLSN